MNRITVDVSTPKLAQMLNRFLSDLRDMGWLVSGCDTSRVSIATAPGLSSELEILKGGANSTTPSENLLEASGLATIERDLVSSVQPGHTVDKVLIGFNWVLVRAGDLCGIARSPSRSTEGARTIRPPEGFVGKDLAELAEHLVSTDPLSRALGLAAVNCFWNRGDPPEETTPLISKRGGLASIEAPGAGALIVGGFRGAMARLPEARIIEREPKPGDISVEDAPRHYASAKSLSITAQTLMNGSLRPILAASGTVPFRNLVGPSCPLCPALFDHGLDELYGAVIRDPDAAEQFITESGTMIIQDHIATSRTLRAPPAITRTGQ